jgi:SAM-dependent methyltransferase
MVYRLSSIVSERKTALEQALDTLVGKLLRLAPPTLRRRLAFAYRYRRGEVPWDTGITPPEVVAFIESGATPGHALDLGCGTGTNVLYLAQHGWDATGVDYVAQAVQQAQERLAGSSLPARVFQGDVTHLEALPLTPPFTLFLDIGCLHSLTPDGQERYAASLAHLAAPDALYMLYSFMPRPSLVGEIGITPERVSSLFTPHFTIERQETSPSRDGWPSAWYWLRRT